ncbi:hypothetical protein [Winogradskyella aurantia]|uniref:Uncharacterized protein n=1 Tax=Winogradskyella aurantia TaxID=1915063 RepID=A0A265V0H2_9FLAO|nr:hypothetical protein [Winogradskyella aurantia]OZV70982.1 hypothetical protein CA834_02380 [Winogradskyella aurantia]
MLDAFYIAIYSYYNKTLGKKSLNIAALYINLLSGSILLVLAAFLMGFARQMNLPMMSDTKFWVLFSLVTLMVTFRNWLYYNGKKRHILKAKTKGKPTSIYLLWLLPFGCMLVGISLLQIP